MTPLEWIALAQLIVLPLAIAAWRTWRADVANEKLRGFVDQAVRAAEELGAAGDMGDDGKAKFVKTLLKQHYPRLTDDVVEVLIHAAVQAAGLGASGKGAPPAV